MKKVQAIVKLQIPAGKANPSPPVGPALGQHGVNIMEFCKGFNARSAKLGDTVVPVIITVFADRSYSFVMKSAPASRPSSWTSTPTRSTLRCESSRAPPAAWASMWSRTLRGWRAMSRD